LHVRAVAITMRHVGADVLWHAAAPRYWTRLRSRPFHEAAQQPPLVLVLDVDETLLRSHVPGVHQPQKLFEYDFACKVQSGGEMLTSPTMSRIDTVNDQERQAASLQTSEVHISLRPGLFNFFEWIRTRRSEGAIEGPWIFTQGSRHYLDALMPNIDPTGDLFQGRVLTREACTRLKRPWPWVHKELNRVPCGEDRGEHPERVILVENNPMSGLLYPDHLLMVHDWVGGNKFDRELVRVSATIDAVLSESSGEPGDYAAKLTSSTVGHDRFKKELDRLHQSVVHPLPPDKTKDQAIKEVWWKAVRAKTRLINQQPYGQPDD